MPIFFEQEVTLQFSHILLALPSLIGYIQKEKKLPPALTFSLAALIAFYNGTEIANAEMTGDRGGSAYPIKDDLPVLERFASLYKEAGPVSADPEAAAHKLSRAVLSAADWWGEDLCAYEGLESAVAGNLQTIWSSGMKAAIEGAVKEF